MILADTSVWVQHFRLNDPRLRDLLLEGLIVTHPFVIGELACSNLARRRETLGALGQLPSAEIASSEEVLRMLEERRLWGKGIRWIDAHLLASAVLSDLRLWTLDEPLRSAATQLRLGAELPP